MVQRQGKDNFHIAYFPLLSNERDPNKPDDMFVFSQKPSTTLELNGNIYPSSGHKVDVGYPVFMPERAFLSFLIAITEAIESRPQHNSFDPSKYLPEKFMEAKTV